MARKKINYDLETLKLLLNEEYNDLDTFLNETEEHFKKLRDHDRSSTLKFISDQTSNIATLRSNKVNIIKELINLEKISIEAQIKEETMNRNENSDNGMKQLGVEVYNILKDKQKSTTLSHLFDKFQKEEIKNEENTSSNENDEDLLAKRMEEINKKKQKKKKKENKEVYGAEKIVEEEKQIEYCLCADVYGKVYATNEEMTEILEDIDTSNIKVYMKENEDGTYRAELEDGTEIPLVEIED